MRPRIGKFGRITYTELNEYLYNNNVFGFIAYRDEDVITYSYHILFRFNKKAPEMLYVKVSRKSKLVLGAYTDMHTFESVDELKTAMKFNG